MKIAVIGLGYVGIPLAIEFGKKIDTIGFDISENRISELKRGFDRTKEVTHKDFNESVKLKLSSNLDEIKYSNIFIIAVPTPIDSDFQPDLGALLSATEMVGRVLKSGDIVIYESTVFPGCTDEVCAPLLEKTSQLTYNKDFFCGYSPERINPGDKKHTLTKIIKITSGSTSAIAKKIDDLYKIIIEAGTFPVKSIKIAEAAKVIENAQRDINIGFVNELSIIFNKMDIKTSEVLDAASTKWNFLNFKPGLVGGHCIGIDPYYLAYKSKLAGYDPEIILTSRKINNKMGQYIAGRIIDELNIKKVDPKTAKCLVLGLTFKENCPDVRNTKVKDVYDELKNYIDNIDISDSWADKEEINTVYGILPIEFDIKNLKNYDIIVLAVKHTRYNVLSNGKWIGENQIIFDVKSIIRSDKVLTL